MDWHSQTSRNSWRRKDWVCWPAAGVKDEESSAEDVLWAKFKRTETELENTAARGINTKIGREYSAGKTLGF